MTPKSLKEPANLPSTPIVEDLPQPIGARSLLWRARFVRPSEWLPHIPLSFWLVEQAKPRRLVVLGLGNGVNHFAYCQAIDRLGLPARAFGIDQWKGDRFGKTEEDAQQTVSWYNETQYQEFSKLLRVDAIGAEAQFEPGTIDLLHIDMELTPGLVDCLSHEWMARLSDQAILVIHRPTRQAETPEAAQFLERLRGRYRCFESPAGAGALVVLVGKSQPERLARLATLEEESQERIAALDLLQRLGDGYRKQADARGEAQRAAALRKELATTKAALTKAEAALSERTASEELLRAALDARSRKAAEAEASLLDRAREMATLRAELAAKAPEQDKSTAEIAALTAKLEAARAESAALASEKQALQKARDAAEAAAATALHEVEAANSAMAAAKSEAAETLARIEAAQAATEAAHAREIRRFEADARDAAARIAELETVRHELLGKLAAAEDALASERALTTETAAKAEALSDRLAAREAALDVAHSTITGLEQRIDGAERRADEAVRSTDRRVDALMAEKATLQGELDARHRELAELADRMAADQTLLAELADARDQATTMLGRRTAELRHQADRLAAAEDAAETARRTSANRIAALEAETSAQAEMLAARFRELGDMAHALNADRHATEEALQERDDAVVRRSRATAEADRLARALAAAEAEAKTARDAAATRITTLETEAGRQAESILAQFDALARAETRIAELEGQRAALAEQLRRETARWSLGRWFARRLGR